MVETRIFTVETLVTPRLLETNSRSGHRPRERKIAVGDLRSAEEVLDWLERKGRTNTELVINGREFVVRWAM